MEALATKIKHTLEMIKFSHSVFALPWALSSMLYAAHGFPSFKLFILIVLAMVTARNAAMGFNRVVDAKMDAENPRTQIRHLPKGLLKTNFVIGFVVVNAVFFIIISKYINNLCFILSPFTLIILFFYSLTKRFTHYTQIFLGLALGLSPLGAWIAVKAQFDLFPALLGLSVLFWVAGFDLIYAAQDYVFDVDKGVYSLVVKWGIEKSLFIARLFHALEIATLVFIGWNFHLSFIYFITIAIMAIFLAYEHSLISPKDLSKLDMAFFTVNGWIGFIFLAGTVAEVLLSKS
ncbi:putative 4-hydroxybenzoate polyprenyltransferase [bacterium]|nr:putative 4-hydroxybenzoate polyprenyltransferase [bacterium]